ncbi:uncharacterized protein LOC112269213 [Brachypodium distachyon]|uniref:uncharacterized protein LOC112269213 n=1 Tax=Brachypodium distachyon TaxID=15368 RepID=UPI000D0D9FA6|nr:uncharacterized protein LOC112269213 [Brachypodium distachyon]|eukprot:XP_024311184.1 uncharacterized protein LOC112269213 [Brachypodium distachyon]
MLFTHVTSGCIPIDAVLGTTFQVYSIKFTELKGFKWPLKVYGVVTARDEVDMQRNPLFVRSRGDCQIITRKDPFLHLTGPCRAIMSEGRIDIEIQLRVKRGTMSQDRALISQVCTFNGDNVHDFRSCLIDNHFCTMELSYEHLEKSVQATIFGVQVVDREAPSPFEYGVRVVCSSLPNNGPQDDVYEEAVLLDSKHGTKHAVKRGYLNLSRQVVSVKLRGRLKVCIQAYTRSGEIGVHGHVFIVPQACNTSQHICAVGGSEVEVTVAWSLLVEDEYLIKINGSVDPSEDLPPLHPTLLEKMGIAE